MFNNKKVEALSDSLRHAVSRIEDLEFEVKALQEQLRIADRMRFLNQKYKNENVHFDVKINQLIVYAEGKEILNIIDSISKIDKIIYETRVIDNAIKAWKYDNSCINKIL